MIMIVDSMVEAVNYTARTRKEIPQLLQANLVNAQTRMKCYAKYKESE